MMAALRLFTSNRLEALAECLAGVLAPPLASPLAGEVIVVQSLGMERWLSLEIARRLGVCANVRFPFPKAFLEEAFPAVPGEASAIVNFAPDIMTWKIMGLLPTFFDRPGFEQVTRYFSYPASTEVEGLKRFQLACRLAWQFDQYLTYRPDMIRAWEKGQRPETGDERWQCDLWRALIDDHRNRNGDGSNFAPKLEPSPFLSRISLFGISSLPPLYLELFHGLSRKIEVNMFLLNPSGEFWGDIRSEREEEKVVRKVRETRKDYTVSGGDLYLERGNRLLASWGTLGREFFSLVWQLSAEEIDVFNEPGEANLLCALQSDILHLRDRGREEKKNMASDDRSIRLHSCHSPLREIEALYDTLLSLFEEDGELLPADILVMAPEIEVYAPLIKAVFDRPAGGAREYSLPRIPFTIADRSSRRESSLIEGFLRIFELAGGRFGAGEVLSLLEIPEIRFRFDISEVDLELIRRWVAKTGIRWGIDEDNRRRLGLPPLKENTWRAGLERLLMGYAVPGEDGKLVDGILPFDLEGSDTILLGRFLDCLETLFSQVQALESGGRSLGEWSRLLENLLDRLFAPLEDGQGMDRLRSQILRLQEMEETSGFKEGVDAGVIGSWFSRIFTEKGFGYGFLGGGITFCSLLPMRSIPFKVICLLGMNGTDYPRRSRTPAFDLMARNPRPGDRSRRKDDRYLFLEALLSARKYLLISYVGRDSADNSILPPSVVVTELLDYLEEGFVLSGNGDIRECLVTEHRLHAFSPAYFQGGDKLFSYSEENWRAAQSLTKEKISDVRACPRLPLPDDLWRQGTIDDLTDFFAHPVRFLFERRLDVKMSAAADLPEERESFSLEGLEAYALGQELLERGLMEEDLKGFYEAARASGRLPHGAVGFVSYERLQAEVQSFVGRIRPLLAGCERSSRRVDLSLAGFRLKGELFLYGGRPVHFRHALLKTRDHLKLWIASLALALAAPGSPSPPGILLGKNEGWLYLAPPDAGEALTVLLQAYWEGLSKPLKFFPRSSWEYGKAVFLAGKTREEGLRAAARCWQGNDFTEGEGADPLYHQCFGDGLPLDEEFEDWAERILRVLFHNREELRVRDGAI